MLYFGYHFENIFRVWHKEKLDFGANEMLEKIKGLSKKSGTFQAEILNRNQCWVLGKCNFT
jgi:hypothetical protein